MMTGCVIVGNWHWSWICTRLERPLKLMMLGLVGVAPVLFELMMAWRRVPIPLSPSLLTVKVDRSWRPSSESIVGRRRRAERRREPVRVAFGARWNHRAGMVGILGLGAPRPGWPGAVRPVPAPVARAASVSRDDV